MEKGKLIAQGRTAEVFEWEKDKILKLFRPGLSKIMIEKEYEISANISNKLSLLPKVYKLIEIDNRSGIIYERINGITMMKVISSKPWKVKKEAQRLAELHKSIQQKVDSYIEKQIINFIRNKFYLEYIKHYIRVTGVKREQIERWELPVAAARLTEWLPKNEKTTLLKFVNMKMENIK